MSAAATKGPHPLNHASIMEGKSKARKRRQRKKAFLAKQTLKLAYESCLNDLQKEKKKCSLLSRNMKTSQRRISSLKLGLRTQSGMLPLTLATSSNRFHQHELSVSVRQISLSMLHVDERDILGEGSFGKCMKGYLQGTEVCLKQLKNSRKEILMREASMLYSLCHHAICFLLGVQCEKEPYYLVLTLYQINGHSLTIHDFMCSEVEASSSKQDVVKELCSNLTSQSWCRLMCAICEGLAYIHSKSIIHRDLKANNVVLYMQGGDLKPVVIDFGKSLKIPTTIKYSLTDAEKKQYRTQHKHIAPDLIDGVSTPSVSSDIYSFGRIFKNLIVYTKFKVTMFEETILRLIKNCLKYNDFDRPTAAKAIEIFNSLND